MSSLALLSDCYCFLSSIDKYLHLARHTPIKASYWCLLVVLQGKNQPAATFNRVEHNPGTRASQLLDLSPGGGSGIPIGKRRAARLHHLTAQRSSVNPHEDARLAHIPFHALVCKCTRLILCENFTIAAGTVSEK